MAVQNCIGDAFRGATWVALHNGGGCGWGEVMNGGFGLVLDGSAEAGAKAANMLAWDVSNGVARRLDTFSSQSTITNLLSCRPQVLVRQRQRPEDHRAGNEEGFEAGGHPAASSQGPIGRGEGARKLMSKL